jgi:hypothetical protein
VILLVMTEEGARKLTKSKLRWMQTLAWPLVPWAGRLRPVRTPGVRRDPFLFPFSWPVRTTVNWRGDLA